MGVKEDFPRGSRVKLDRKLTKDLGINKGEGIVKGYGRMQDTISVLWDGETTNQQIHPLLLEIIEGLL